MFRTRELFKFAMALAIVSLGTSTIWAQAGLTRHQRIADSILRRKAASEFASRKLPFQPQELPAKLPIQGSVGVLQEALPTGDQPPNPNGFGFNDLLSTGSDANSSDAAAPTQAPAVPQSSEAPPSIQNMLEPTPAVPTPAQPAAATAAGESTISDPSYPVAPPTAAPSFPEAQSIVQDQPVESYGVESSGGYPVTPHQPLTVPSSVNYEDPFASPLPAPIYSDASSVIGGCDACGGGCDGHCSGAPACGNSGCSGVGCIGCGGHRRGWISTFSLMGGVHGFKNGVNRGNSGSFGFQEGFNLGSPFNFSALGMQSQVGFRATQTDFNGSSFTVDSRSQFFVTAGLFKRNVNGWQGGFVIDYLHDDWYTTIDLGQLRGELSYAAANGSSVGLMFTTGLFEDDTTSVLSGTSVEEDWETLDYYAFFYEVQSNHHRRGKWRVWVGLTGESDGIIGSDFKIPLAGTWSLEPGFTYVVPDEATGNGANAEEAWNVGVNLVWYPGRAMGDLNYRRLPMFDVAGNGSMVSRRK
jgi:hypothetical protein